MLSDDEISAIFSVRRGAVTESHLLGCARAIESAATAPLLARIAELEAQNNLLHRLMVSGEWRGVEKGLEESSTRIAELERELEEARKDAAYEREECAKVAKAISDKYAFGHYGNEVDTADEIEAAIRARGKTTPPGQSQEEEK